MKKIICFCLFTIFSVTYGQNISVSPSQYKANKWRLGGGIGLGFGSNDYFGIAISPFVGYEIAPSVEAGLTAGYQYSKWSESKQNLFNVGPYFNFYPIPSLFLRAHYEYYTGNNKYKEIYLGGPSQTHSYNFNESVLWLGAGYRSTGRVQFYTGLMYNVLFDDDTSLFSTGFRPIVGVSFGL